MKPSMPLKLVIAVCAMTAALLFPAELGPAGEPPAREAASSPPRGELTLYAPAPGRAEAANDLATLYSCSVQGAQALYSLCPPYQYRWSSPTVYFLDHTHSSWQVRASVAKWNESTAVNAVYRWYTSGCPVAYQCVDVYSGNYGSTPWAARTDYRYYGRTFVAATIRLNDYYATSSTDRRATSCHETGHGLGLDHNYYRSSCLFWQEDGYVTPYPGVGDWSVLHQIY